MISSAPAEPAFLEGLHAQAWDFTASSVSCATQTRETDTRANRLGTLAPPQTRTAPSRPKKGPAK